MSLRSRSSERKILHFDAVGKKVLKVIGAMVEIS